MKKIFLVLLLMTTVAQAETYTWTDKEGIIHFSDSLGDAPADYRKSVKHLGIDTNKTVNKARAVSSSESGQSADGNGSVATKVEELKERMQRDEGTMALISAMQNDPEMQAILSDPAILRAIQSGDVGALTNNPDFLKLLNNPRVREIGKRMEQGGAR